MSEAEARIEALRLATATAQGELPEDTVARAAAYLDFLIGRANEPLLKAA
jgi:hypothetical protein